MMNSAPLPLLETDKIAHFRNKIPRKYLASYPTPLIRAERLEKQLTGTNFWFKRDDLISFGLGGNKARGLEVILADALNKNANTLVTGAGVLSNHVRTTAAVASAFGLNCEAIYWGNKPEKIVGNLQIVQMLGAHIHYTAEQDRSSVDHWITKVSDDLKEQGQIPYPIPRGGACAMGVLGHLLAVFELYEQCQELNIQPQRIILAVGSGGTYAGWLLGIHLLNLPWELIGFSVSRQSEEIKKQVTNLAMEAATSLGLNILIPPDQLLIHDNFIGDGYGIPSNEGNEAIKIVCQAEGVLLDPVYTGKAMAGFISEVKNNPTTNEETSIFIHSGGEPSYFALSE